MFHFSVHRRQLALHSFPTRRSSDLASSQLMVPPSRAPRKQPACQTQTPRNAAISPAAAVPPVSARNRAVHDETRRGRTGGEDRKSTRLNSSHITISYAVFCLKKKQK